MEKADAQMLLIFGASGDLTTRKLIPALYELYVRNLLPEISSFWVRLVRY